MDPLPSPPPQTVEIDSLADFDTQRVRTDRLFGWFVSSVDLTGRTAELLTADPRGAVFLGCPLSEEAEAHLRVGGALLFPRLPELPFDPYRGGLYAARELFDGVVAGDDYSTCTDGRVYGWTRALPHPPHVSATLAMSLHDHAVADALDDALSGVAPALTVGVMGGHAAERGTADYAAAAQLGLALAASGRTVLTGGGPGAMEAANLGASLVNVPDAIDDVIARLATAPTFKAPVGIDAWARVALAVVAELGDRLGPSIGIPTWFYGHEPPNVFATWIAKYFSNALREDTLLARCRGGIVYLPGRAGTVTEIFQATTANYYATQPDQVAPMVLVGRGFWTSTLPAWPLLQTLAAGRPMGEQLFLVDSVPDALAVIAP